MLKFITLFFLLISSSMLQATYQFHVINDVHSEKFKNRKTDFIEYWMPQNFETSLQSQEKNINITEEFIKTQTQQLIEKRWDEYLKNPNEYFVLAEESNGEPIAFVFYVATLRQKKDKDQKRWAFLSGYSVCPGKEDKEKDIMPLLLDEVCENAKTPRILTVTSKINKKMQKLLVEYNFEEEKFEKEEIMKPNWLGKYPVEKLLYYKTKR